MDKHKFLEHEKNVIETNKKIVDLSKTNSEVKRLYKGCEVYFTPWIRNPDLMLVGINPGAGFYKQYKEIIQSFTPKGKHYDESSFGLAREIKWVFSQLGKESILKNTFKTNYYYYATENEKELDLLFRALPRELVGEIENNSKKWIKMFVEEFNPKLIICEGIKSFRKFLQAYHPNYDKVHEGKYVKYTKINGIPVFAFMRLFSTIPYAEDFVAALREKYFEKGE
jgi:hypothetical protein